MKFNVGRILQRFQFMNGFSFVRLMKNKKLMMFLFFALFNSSVVRAETVQVSAKAIGEAGRPLSKFVDTTKTLKCGSSIAGSAICPAGTDVKMLGTNIRFDFGKEATGISLGIPVEGSSVSLKHADGTSGPMLSFALKGVGGVLSDKGNADTWAPSGDPRPGKGNLLIGEYFGASPPLYCAGSPATVSSGKIVNFFWVAGVGGYCSKVKNGFPNPLGKFNDAVSVSNAYYQYDLELPDPLTMKAGVYTGSVSYQVLMVSNIVPPNAIFGMFGGLGRNGSVSDSSLNINFVITVPLIFKVVIPPGGNKVELIPEEGWQRWLLSQRRPTRLLKNQTYRLSSNLPFTMRLECQWHSGNGCALRDPSSGNLLPLEVNTSLPSGFTDSTGERVNNHVLEVSGAATGIFKPRGFAVDEIGKLDLTEANLQFVVKEEQVTQMLSEAQSNSSRKYQGNVTVVWEADL